MINIHINVLDLHCRCTIDADLSHTLHCVLHQRTRTRHVNDLSNTKPMWMIKNIKSFSITKTQQFHNLGAITFDVAV